MEIQWRRAFGGEVGLHISDRVKVYNTHEKPTGRGNESPWNRIGSLSLVIFMKQWDCCFILQRDWSSHKQDLVVMMACARQQHLELQIYLTQTNQSTYWWASPASLFVMQSLWKSAKRPGAPNSRICGPKCLWLFCWQLPSSRTYEQHSQSLHNKDGTYHDIIKSIHIKGTDNAREESITSCKQIVLPSKTMRAGLGISPPLPISNVYIPFKRNSRFSTVAGDRVIHPISCWEARYEKLALLGERW